MTEREVIVELYKSGWQPEEIVLIADASDSRWQNSESRQKGGVSAGHRLMTYSARRRMLTTAIKKLHPAWEMHAPTTWKLRDKALATPESMRKHRRMQRTARQQRHL